VPWLGAVITRTLAEIGTIQNNKIIYGSFLRLGLGPTTPSDTSD
jgi:hypothetical protein